jgi:DNA polymerase III delta prime subunit
MSYLCEQEDHAPCLTCRNCIQFKADSHPDVESLTPAKDKTTIGVADIRTIQKWMDLAPVNSENKKCLIIPDADLMSREAANAFLKTLEEPHPGSIILMTTSHAETLLPTVLSRCHQIRFMPLTDTETESVIRHWPDSPKENLEAIVAFCAGCPGRAVDIQRFNLAQLSEWISESFLNASPTASPIDQAERILDICAEVSSDPREPIRVFLDILCGYITTHLRKKIDLSQETLFALHDCVLHFKGIFQSNTNVKLTLDAFFIQARRIIQAESLSPFNTTQNLFA